MDHLPFMVGIWCKSNVEVVWSCCNISTSDISSEKSIFHGNNTNGYKTKINNIVWCKSNFQVGMVSPAKGIRIEDITRLMGHVNIHRSKGMSGRIIIKSTDKMMGAIIHGIG